MTTIALMGAGGKMGCRITRNMKDLPDYKMQYVEISKAGRGQIFQPDWKKVMKLENIRQSVKEITDLAE